MRFLDAHFAVSLALASVLWTVQLVIYPAFKFIDPAQFERWHYRYTGAISWIVAPLILTQTSGVAGRLVVLGWPDGIWWIEFISTLIAWAVTCLVSIPLHKSLQRERTEAAMSSLVRTNWWRTAAWTLSAMCSGLATRT